MNRICQGLVWLSRIHRCLGFGIQSPTDYAFVRYVINERWPYYAYEQLTDGDWLTQKLGRLYLRLANWRQPQVMVQDDYRQWWQAGCRKTTFVEPSQLQHIELFRLPVEDFEGKKNYLLSRCDNQSVLVLEGIYRNWQQWKDIASSPLTGTTFDLYYCGIVLFDKERYKHNYRINF